MQQYFGTEIVSNMKYQFAEDLNQKKSTLIKASVFLSLQDYIIFWDQSEEESKASQLNNWFKFGTVSFPFFIYFISYLKLLTLIFFYFLFIIKIAFV